MAEVKDKIVTVDSLKTVYDTINKRIAPYNLLDNSDFGNPVNQRGKTTYTGAGYTIDRWKSNSGNSIVAVNDGYLTLLSSDTNSMYFQQFIEDGVIKNGCQYTVSCTLTNGSVFTATGEASTTMTEAIRYLYIDGRNVGNIRFKYDGHYGLYLVIFNVTANTTNGVNIANVALYEGDYDDDTLPEYRPKGYGVELVECQRHFVALRGRTDESSMISDGASNGEAFYSFLTLPVPMRGTDTPTVTYNGVNIYPYVVNASVAVTELKSATILDSRNHMCIRFTHASNAMTEKQVGILRLAANGYIYVSADLGN